MRKQTLVILSFYLLWVNGCASNTRPRHPISQAQADPNATQMNIDDDDLGLFDEEFSQAKVKVPDPLQPLNRCMFGINDTLYFWILKPVGTGYKAVVAEPIRLCIKNFFSNLATPVRLTNCLLQGKGQAAGTEIQRFLINSTEGLLGLGDPARDKHGIMAVDEDLGQTLAVYGFRDGVYLVLPLFGPTTLRDGIGSLGDHFLDPTHYVQPWEAYLAVSGTQFVNNISFHLDTYETLKAESIDPYIAMRDVYIQYRQGQIEK